MIDYFTKSIVREIGRNVGKTVSNKLLGDTHSTPYRRVNSSRKKSTPIPNVQTVVEGKNYTNKLDKLIKTFEVKGVLATFNSAQNIYNAYFEMVEKAIADDNYSPLETANLVEEYCRTVPILITISGALHELGAGDKSKIVNEKIISLNEFIKELDNNFEAPSMQIKEVNKMDSFYSIFYGFMALWILSCLIIWFYIGKNKLSTEFEFLSDIDSMTETILIIIAIASFILTTAFSIGFSKKKKRVLNNNQMIDLINQLKNALTEAVKGGDLITKGLTENKEVNSLVSRKNGDPLNIEYFKNRKP